MKKDTQLEFETRFDGVDYLVTYCTDGKRNRIMNVNLSLPVAGTIPVDVEELRSYQQALYNHIVWAMNNNAESYWAQELNAA